jgi:hypothetical protein
MLRYRVNPQRSRNQSGSRHAKISLLAPALLLMTGLMSGTASAPALAKPFKVTNVHFETNASACDMGVQIGFDTEGITEGAVEDPNGNRVYSLKTAAGMKAIGGQTEGFLEGVEPQIIELLSALGCKPSNEEGKSTLAALFAAWPAGLYTFTGQHKGTTIKGQDRLTHHIPAGPKIVAPANATVVPDAPLLIKWKQVTTPILTDLGPVNIVGYHVVVVETGAEALPQLDVDLAATETSVKVPAQYLKPNTIYAFEVLATEESGNQTISEGFFCTVGVADCVFE